MADALMIIIAFLLFAASGVLMLIVGALHRVADAVESARRNERQRS